MVDDIECLRLFNERVDDLAKTRLIREDALHLRTKIEWNAAHQLKMTTEGTDEDDLRSFLLTFRQFVAAKEPIYLHRIFNICQRRITNEAIRNNIAHARQVWKNRMRSEGFLVTLDDVVMTPEHVSDLMINGYYFHNDSAYRGELDHMWPIGREITKALFVDFVVNATNVVFYLDGAIRQCFRDGHLGESLTT